MRSRERLLTLTSVVLFLASCTSKEKAQTHTFRIYEENGVTITETTGGPKHTEPLFAYEEVLTLKQDPQREESLLYMPNGLIMDADGNIEIDIL